MASMTERKDMLYVMVLMVPLNLTDLFYELLGMEGTLVMLGFFDSLFGILDSLSPLFGDSWCVALGDLWDRLFT